MRSKHTVISHAPMPTQLPSRVRQPTLEPTFSHRVFEARHWLVAALIGSGALLIPSTTLLASLDPAISEVVAMTGMTLVVASATMRTWAGLYIGGRKNQDVVRDGPYALARNPLYLGNLLATTGIVLLSGSIVVAALALPAIFLIFLFTIKSEEAKLSGKFGPAFKSYRATVPMFVPRPSAIRRFLEDDSPKIISHRNVARELRRGAIVVGLGLLAFVLGNFSF